MTRYKLLAALLALAVTVYPFEKKKKEEITQTLELPKDPPVAQCWFRARRGTWGLARLS